MNTPNKLTIMRILLAPLLVFVLLMDIDNEVFRTYKYLIALIIFGIAAVTDAIDGRMARKRGLVTDFGKFIDPLADKLLVTSVFICFIQMGYTGAVPIIIIIMRDFFVTSVRLVAVHNGAVVAATLQSKIKTVVHMISISVILAMESVTYIFLPSMAVETQHAVYPVFDFIMMTLIWLCASISIVSGFEFYTKNKEYITSKEKPRSI